MSLPQGTEAPGAANKAASLSGADAAGYATTAMQALNAAQAAQRQREMTDAAIWEKRNPLADKVVGKSGMDTVNTSFGGGFPTVGQGFARY